MLDTTGIEQEYLDTPTLAKLAGVTTSIVVLDIKQRIIPAEKRPDRRGERWGGCWFIRAEDAQKYIDAKKAVSQSISAYELAKRTGQDRHKIVDAILRGDLLAFRRPDNPTRLWFIREEDARAYSQRMGWTYVVEEVQPNTNPQNQMNGHIQTDISVVDEQSLVPSDIRCGACGTTRGNIIGHRHKDTREIRGYLCSRCLKIVEDAQDDIDRVNKILVYLKHTQLDKAP